MAKATGTVDKQQPETGYVAFLDILGFKEILRSGDFPDMFRRYCKLINGPVQQIPVDGIPNMRKVMFSDSIVITTTNADHFALRALGETVAQISFSLMTQLHLPVRGCITFGDTYWMQYTVRTAPEISIDVMVAGRPIVRAYELQENHDWVGVMLDPLIHKRLPKLRNWVDVSELAGKSGYDLLERLLWCGTVQRNTNLPLKRKGERVNSLECYAVVPRKSRRPSLKTVVDEMREYSAALSHCFWTVDKPEVQSKYTATKGWLAVLDKVFEGLVEEDFYRERPDGYREKQ